MKWRSSSLLIRMEWSIRLSDELNRKYMEWAILCASGFSFWGTELMCFQIFSFWGTELMCFQIFFRGQNLCVSRCFLFGGQNLCDSRYFLFEVDRIYVFPDIIFLRWIEFMCFQIFFRGQNLCVSNHFLVDRTYVCFQIFFLRAQFIYSRRWIGHKEHF